MLRPGTTRLPVILPIKVPIKNSAVVILPVASIFPAVVKLPPVMLPEVLSVPETLTPVPEATSTLAVPAELTVTLPLAATLTFDVPFTKDEAVAALVPPTVKEPPAGLVITTAVEFAVIVAPAKSMLLPARYKSLKRCDELPKSYVTLADGKIFPDTVSSVNVPTLVILGCAAVINVPDTLPVIMLPAFKFPVVVRLPVIDAPVLAKTATLPTPPTPILTGPLNEGIATLLVPLAMPVTTTFPEVLSTAQIMELPS